MKQPQATKMIPKDNNGMNFTKNKYADLTHSNNKSGVSQSPLEKHKHVKKEDKKDHFV